MPALSVAGGAVFRVSSSSSGDDPYIFTAMSFSSSCAGVLTLVKTGCADVSPEKWAIIAARLENLSVTLTLFILFCPVVKVCSFGIE